MSDDEYMHAQDPESPFAGTVDAAAAAAATTASLLQLLQTRLGAHSQHQRLRGCDATSPAERCFADGLHIIFSFLSLDSFGVASRCCHRWADAAATQPRRADSLSVRTRERLKAAVRSPLTRHIDTIDLRQFVSDPNAFSSLNHLLHFCLRLPPNTRTMIDIDPRREWHDGDGIVHQFSQTDLPSTVRAIDLWFRTGDWGRVDSVLARLCHHDSPPITLLRLHLHVVVGQQIPVATLRHLLHLKDSLVEFEIVYAWGARFADERLATRNHRAEPARWTQEHIDVFRQMKRLERLNPFGGRWSDEELIMLAAAPAPAHLRILPINSPPATPEGIESLVRLPLTSTIFLAVGASSGPIRDLSFLGRMPTLESIRLDFTMTPHDTAMQYHAHIDALVDALANCTRLGQLSLSVLPLTNDHLRRLLPSLKNLRNLTISSHQLDGLSFASSVPHLARTLEFLSLSNQSQFNPTLACSTMPISEPRHLHALTNLRWLNLSLVVPSSTTEDAIVQAHDELDFNKPTFRRDLWPHMGYSCAGIKKPEDLWSHQLGLISHLVGDLSSSSNTVLLDRLTCN